MRADANVYPLAAAASTTGAAVAIRGGIYSFLAGGTAGGATISLQIQMPDGSWSAVTVLPGSAAVSATTLPYAATGIELPACNVRAAITGGSGVSVNASLAGIG